MEALRMACGALEAGAAARKDAQRPPIGSGRGGSGLIPVEELDAFSRAALDFHGLGRVGAEELVTRVRQAEWGERKEIVTTLLQELNALRARKAGLQLRQEDAGAAAARSREAAAKAEALQSAEARAAELRRELQALDDDPREAEAKALARRLERHEEALDGRLGDLRAALRTGSKRKSAEAPERPDPAALQGALDKAKARLHAAKQRCLQFERAARDFEKRKREACAGSDRLQALTAKLGGSSEALERSQQERAARQAALATLRRAAHEVVSKTLAAGEEQGAGAQKSQAFALATSLDILVRNGGDMLLDDWKRAISDALGHSGAKTIQHVYGLVAHSLVRIDRTQRDARAVAALLW